ncbi:Sec-independent protein translocase protein TatB [Neotabrizicola shimadae]|uniref:Sec-independent protein translocase protein TatB n=1 Tax=Neotabrizicola shimadae TaxID=2807096 RepID=A0A8G0ZX59_9RHOB|nr:Sec-independent protein translocase protein TatB [Neotabrizicola shimadae]QYZ71060.1 twin-arginine translocase subunit TatB [Neotabrizicola shimadae]
MFDIGWTELLLIGIVALIVIGPKDLPEMFRTLGRFTAKARAMAREFQRAMEQAANESGVGDVAKDLKDVTSPKNMGLKAVKDAADKFEKWDPLKNAAKPTAPAAPRPAVPTNSLGTGAEAAAAAGVAAAEPAATVDPGPATKALYEARAEKAAIAREAAEKMRAVDSAAAETDGSAKT